jgi:poly(A) polymerase Pap1
MGRSKFLVTRSKFLVQSFIVQVHGPGADIDTLCVGPRHATRNVSGPTFKTQKFLCHYDVE